MRRLITPSTFIEVLPNSFAYEKDICNFLQMSFSLNIQFCLPSESILSDFLIESGVILYTQIKIIPKLKVKKIDFLL